MEVHAHCAREGVIKVPYSGPNFIELLLAKHNKIILTRIGLPDKIVCHMYNLILVSCCFLLSRKCVCIIFCSSLKLSSDPRQLMKEKLSMFFFKSLSVLTFKLLSISDFRLKKYYFLCQFAFMTSVV